MYYIKVYTKCEKTSEIQKEEKAHTTYTILYSVIDCCASEVFEEVCLLGKSP